MWYRASYFFLAIHYNIVNFFSNKKVDFSLEFYVVKEIFKKIIVFIFIALFLGYLDSIFVDNYPHISFINSFDPIFTSFLIGSIGLAAVILSLYCSNINSIYSAIYINAPESLSKIFEDDIRTNRNMDGIVNYITLCSIFLFEILLGRNLSFCSVFAVFIYAIYIFANYRITNRRSHWMSNTFRLAYPLYLDIKRLIRKASGKNVYSSQNYFQKHFSKLCRQKIEILDDIIKYNINNSKSQNSAMLEFMKANNQVVIDYWKNKKTVYYDSMWFQKEVQYPQWHKSADSLVLIALKTGTPLPIEFTKNKTWLEEMIQKTNAVGLDKFFKDNDIDSLVSHILSLSHLASHSVEGNSLNFMLKHLESLQNDIFQFFDNISEPKNLSSKDTYAIVIDSLTTAYINIICGLNKLLTNLNLDDIFRNLKNYTCFNEIDFNTNWFLNNQEIERLYDCIEAEFKLERKRITPDWIIDQSIAYSIFNELNTYILSIDRLFNRDLLAIYEYLFNKKMFYASMISITEIIECNAKLDITLKTVESTIQKLREKKKDDSFTWDNNVFANFISNRKNTVNKIPELFAKCTPYFAIEYWDKREQYPDLLGHCYNYLCEYLISAIESNDFEKFDNGYINFLNTMLLYQEYIRNDIITFKDNVMQETGFHAFLKPMIEYASISGLAIIWGEFNQCKEWKDLVGRALLDFYDLNKEKAKATLEKWITLTSIGRNKWFISNRDTINISWENRVSNKISELNLNKSEIIRNSNILKSFLNPSFSSLGISMSDEVYLVICLNKYLPQDKQYETFLGWEKRLNHDKK